MRCQFIEGEPTGDDRCKCRRKAVDGPWCEKHRKMLYIKVERQPSPHPAPRPELRTDYA